MGLLANLRQSKAAFSTISEVFSWQPHSFHAHFCQFCRLAIQLIGFYKNSKRWCPLLRWLSPSRTHSGTRFGGCMPCLAGLGDRPHWPAQHTQICGKRLTRPRSIEWVGCATPAAGCVPHSSIKMPKASYAWLGNSSRAALRSTGCFRP